MRFKTDWASLIVERKFTVFACFYFVFEGNFPSTRPRGAYIWRGDLTEGFLRYRLGGLYLEGLIHGGLGLGHIFSNIKSSSLFVSGNYSLTNKSEDSGGTSLLTYRNVYIGSIEFSICQRRLLQKKKQQRNVRVCICK